MDRRAKNTKSCLQLLVKSPFQRYHTRRTTLLANQQTRTRQKGVPDKYFLPLGGNIKEAISKLEINAHLRKTWKYHR